MRRQKKKVEPQQQPLISEVQQPVSAPNQPNHSAPVSIGERPAIAIPVVTAKPSRLRSTTELLTPSATNSNQQHESVATLPQAPDVTTKVTIRELTLENLQHAWYEFADLRKIQKNSTTEEIALRRDFKLAEHSIEIALDNDHQLEAIQSMRYDLMGFLKARLNAPKLDINPRVAPLEVSRLPYTPAEKFNYLAEKNPHLLELKQALGLDVDF